MVMRFGSVSLSSIHEARASTDLSKVITRAGSSHLVTCVEVSPGLPQLGHLSARSLTQCALAEVHPHMPDTCFVTQLLNNWGNAFIACPIPTQYITSYAAQDILEPRRFLLANRFLHILLPRHLERLSAIDPTAFSLVVLSITLICS